MKNIFTLSDGRSMGWWLMGLVLLLVFNGRVALAQTCSGTDPSGQPATNGLYAEYWRGYFDDDQGFFSDLQNLPAKQQVVAQVDFPTSASWGNLLPVASGTADAPESFSTRLRGSLRITTPGEYTFYLTADDGAYLWLDGEAVALPPSSATALIDNGGGHSVRTIAATVTLSAGLHNVLIHYGASCCVNSLTWEYDGPGITRQVVPASVLCTAVQPAPLSPRSLAYSPASLTTAPGATGTSATPSVTDGGSAVTSYAVANASTLPAGISINAATGALAISAAVPSGSYSVAVAATNANGTSIFRNAFQFVVTAPLPSGCGGTNPGGQPATAGLYAEYFAGYFADDVSFFTNNTPGLVRTDAQLNFATDESWGNLLPVAGSTAAGLNNFSARFRGSIYLAQAGTYTFYLTSDDASYLWLGNEALAALPTLNKAVVSNGGSRAVQTIAATVTLSAGLHNLQLLYGDGVGLHELKLEYESAGLGIARQVVPAGLFCTSAQPAVVAPTTLRYRSSTLRLAIGTRSTSGMPTVTSASPITGFAMVNDEALPEGIAINAQTGEVSVESGVAMGRYPISVAARNAEGTSVFSRALSVVVAPAAPTGCGGLSLSGTVASSGLYATYYAGYFNEDISFFNTAPVLMARTENELNFDSADSWGDLTDVATTPLENPDGFSARFQGRIQIPTAGEYTFYLTSDDGSLMWLDGAALGPTIENALIDNRGGHPATTLTATATLTAGLHDMLVVYGDNVGTNVLRLEYENTAAGIARQVVPVTSLCSSRSDAPLPVVLSLFKAQAGAAGVGVSWETSVELNSAAFVVERSANGQVFEPIGRVAAAGSTHRRQSYSFTDRAPLSGLSYYRLRQLDTDGSEHLSGVVTVRWNKAAKEAQLTVFPNPSATGTCTVRLEQEAAAAAQLQVLDLTGRTVYSQNLSAAASQEHTFPTRQLRTGVYIVRLTSAQGTITQRLEIR
ncbi:T9SS C-terminal target domain-containing protein [Hymenobacter sediminis]|uniref:PA14 domain-containing protein n=1 Tax=Hymenobacter sediminis TaxID=2218621 RepID=UPI000DA64A4F|nr:PA14 domain-containing protein [Hymenobacter sediminis]RPD46248.1 T9SS C-terminal target domain-containing protein [Hymenobacter sediminis]